MKIKKNFKFLALSFLISLIFIVNGCSNDNKDEISFREEFTENNLLEENTQDKKTNQKDEEEQKHNPNNTTKDDFSLSPIEENDELSKEIKETDNLIKQIDISEIQETDLSDENLEKEE